MRGTKTASGTTTAPKEPRGAETTAARPGTAARALGHAHMGKGHSSGTSNAFSAATDEGGAKPGGGDHLKGAGAHGAKQMHELQVSAAEGRPQGWHGENIRVTLAERRRDVEFVQGWPMRLHSVIIYV
eukprot:1831521-Pyramimonas_sp.AAC.1